jgi:small-conductance mechanosensitive channel
MKFNIEYVTEHLEAILFGSGIFFGSLLVGLLLKLLLFALLAFYNRKTPSSTFIPSFLRHQNKPMGYFLPLLAAALTLPLLPVTPAVLEVLRRVMESALIITFAWVLIKAVEIFEDLFLEKYEISKVDNYRERKMLTQLQFVRRLIMIGIVVVAVSLILMSFETVRRLGAGILTSAGILGIIVGFAAQRSIANLLAGFQIAFTQPLRLDDVVVVEGEFGRVEEITLTYIVLRLWDARRLILPINYFIEKPFQNWSRTTTDIIGSVFFHADYSLPVDEVRLEFKRILDGTDLWDKRVWALQVTDAKEKTIEVRAIMSASNASRAFDLRCLVREKLVGYVQQNFPQSLPQTRALLS